jgi:integrase
LQDTAVLVVARSDVVPSPIKHRGKWRIRWFDATGKRQSEVHDTFKQAAHALRVHEVETADIRAGLRPPTPADRTFDQLCDYWLEHRATQKRSGEHDRSIIRAHLRPAFGALRIRDVTVEEGDRFVRERRHLDKKTIANHVTLLISMLNLARDLGWLLVVPKIKKPKIAVSQAFAYLTTKDDVRRFLEAARQEGEHIFALYATAVWTGLRAGELACLEWKDVNFSTRLITVQRSFNGPTKSDAVRHVPILDDLLTVLRAWRLRNPLSVVFPNQDGHPYGESARVFQEIFHRVLARAGFPMTERRGKERHYLRFHDLRHTFASHWMMEGGDLFKLQKILGHKDVSMTMRYAHLAPHAFEADYKRFRGMAPKTQPAKVFRLPPGVKLSTHLKGNA